MTKTPKSKIADVVVTLRPRHWIKNTFVYAPLVFSGRFTQIDICLRATLAFISFCLVSSAIYAINDVCDQAQYRQHLIKKFRPVASGAISAGSAIMISAALLISGLILSGLLNWSVTLCVSIYFLINVAYSLFIKHIAILDVLTISAGFVLRIIGGGASILVIPSYWLVLCTVLISIFLGFTKRRVELLSVDTEQNNPRPVLKDYSIAILDQIIPIVTSTTILAYALYTVDEHTLMVLGTRAMLLTLPFVIYGLLRYIYIIYHLKKCADPTENLISDKPTIINLTLWVVTSLLVVKYGGELNFFH